MCKATRNHKIVEHLRERFKERYGIELTRDKRQMLLYQIHNNVGELTTRIKDNIELWKVALYNQATYSNQHFTVMYDKKVDQIRTVLPPIDSKDFQEFCDKVGIPQERLVAQRLTAKERTNVSVKRVLKDREHKAVVKESLKRLEQYKNLAQFIR